MGGNKTVKWAKNLPTLERNGDVPTYSEWMAERVRQEKTKYRKYRKQIASSE